MIRDFILLQLHAQGKKQKQLSEETGVEYTALNQFLNNKKGLRYSKIETILDCIGYKLNTECANSVRDAAWLTIRLNHLGMRKVAQEIGVSYNLLYGFLYNKNNMTIDKVERLLKRLDITIEPK